MVANFTTMELIVWFENMPREVCGVTKSTTCHDVIIALAQSVSSTGRFTLVERFRGSERPLPPNESPLNVMARYGDNAHELQFVLRRREPSTNNAYNATPSLPSSNPSGQQPRSDKNLNLMGNHSSGYEVSSDDLCRKLKDHLAYQEHEIEYNRMKLLQLDKQLASLEMCTWLEHDDAAAQLAAQEAELFQLQTVNWTHLLQNERAQAVQGKAEKAQWETRVREADERLIQAKDQIKRLESDLAQERQRQLGQIEMTNQKRREEIAALEAELQMAANQSRDSNNRSESSQPLHIPYNAGPQKQPSGLWV